MNGSMGRVMMTGRVIHMLASEFGKGKSNATL